MRRIACNTAYMLAGGVGVKHRARLFRVALIAFGSVIYRAAVLLLQGISLDDRRSSFAPVADALWRFAWRP